MESPKTTITVTYQKITLSDESRQTVLNMLINCLRPLHSGDRHTILSDLCDEFNLRIDYDY